MSDRIRSGVLSVIACWLFAKGSNLLSFCFSNFREAGGEAGDVNACSLTVVHVRVWLRFCIFDSQRIFHIDCLLSLLCRGPVIWSPSHIRRWQGITYTCELSLSLAKDIHLSFAKSEMSWNFIIFAMPAGSSKNISKVFNVLVEVLGTNFFSTTLVL